MRHWIRGLLVACLVLPMAQAQDLPPAEIRLASEAWPGHTEADGTGLGWDVLRKVFQPEGILLKIHSVPYTRSIGLVQRAEADAWLGSYRDEVEGVIYPRWHYDADQACALSLASAPVPTLSNIGRYRLVWLRGYDYQDYLPDVRDFDQIQRRAGVRSMLDQGHADFFIDARTEVEDVLKDSPQPERYRVTPLMQLPLYLGFANTPRGRQLAEIFDRRMSSLVASGELRPLFQRWKQPYPFDKNLEKPHAAP